MCITVNHASLSKTKILSLPLQNGNHFIAYSNKVKNLSGKPNAMILAIPGTTKQEWFYNTESYKNFLEEIVDNADLDKWVGVLSRGMEGFLSFESFQVGMYNVGLANSFDGALEFIKSLPEQKKPELKENLISFFRKEYEGWSFAVCCFDSDKTIDAQPIAFEYKPFNSDFIYFPTLDAHNGDAPDLNTSVAVDHTLIFEHTGKFDKTKYIKEFLDLKAPVPEFLNYRKYRFVHMEGRAKNGDTYIKVNDINNFDFSTDPRLYRLPPVPYTESEKYSYELYHEDGTVRVEFYDDKNFKFRIHGPISVVSKAIGGKGDEDYSNNTVEVTEKHLKTEAERMYAILEISKICMQNNLERISKIIVPYGNRVN